jgi:hypothetical protein
MSVTNISSQRETWRVQNIPTCRVSKRIETFPGGAGLRRHAFGIATPRTLQTLHLSDKRYRLQVLIGYGLISQAEQGPDEEKLHT